MAFHRNLGFFKSLEKPRILSSVPFQSHYLIPIAARRI